MRKQPAITEATRKKFTDKFCELYEKKPIDRITVREILSRCTTTGLLSMSISLTSMI